MGRLIRFWKPYGVLSQFTDPDGRPTLADFVPVEKVYAAGRLDSDSEGLMLLTDDGRLQQRLADPKFKLLKTYLAQVEGVPGDDALAHLCRGVKLKDGLTRPAEAELLEADPGLPDRPVPIRFRANIPTSWIRMSISEGKNRQVRRMTAAVGHPTLRLVRWSMGPITLEGLEPGAWEEVKGKLGL